MSMNEDDTQIEQTPKEEILEGEVASDAIVNEPADTEDGEQAIPNDEESAEPQEEQSQPETPAGFSTNKIVAMVITLVVLAAIGVFAFISYGNYAKSYAMTFYGQKVSIEEYKLFKIFQTGAPDAQALAIESLTNARALEKATKDLAIVLTPEQTATVLQSVEDLKTAITENGEVVPAITDERLMQILSIYESSQQLVDAVAKDYAFDQAGFDSELIKYKASTKLDYVNMQVKYIICKTQEAADAAKAKIAAGTAFDDVIKSDSTVYSAESGIDILPLRESGLPEDITNILLNLKVSETSDVVNLGSDFIIFQAFEIDVTPDEEIAAEFKEMYIENEKYKLFQVALEKWVADAQVVVNQKAIDAYDAEKAAQVAAAPAVSEAPKLEASSQAAESTSEAVSEASSSSK